MQIMIKETRKHEPTIINGVIVIRENVRAQTIEFEGVNSEGKMFCHLHPKQIIEYFRKVGD